MLLSRNASNVVVATKSKHLGFTNTRNALKGNSVFIKHTYDKNIYIPTYNDISWQEVQYFPWNDHLNYTVICKNVLKRITSNKTFYIISGSFNGGLGHKYISILHSITYAILLRRRFLRKLLIFFTSSKSSREFLGRDQQLLSTSEILRRL